MPIETSRGIINATEKITTASTKFMNAPAARMISRFQAFCFVRLRGSSESSSPSSRTNPPSGSALTLYSVSPRLNANSRGG